MKIVGLTGGIGSGKSTVGELFKALGVPVYNSDERAKFLMNTSKKLKSRIIQLFGEMAYDDTELNRAFIAKKVFNDTELLARLNAIVHPAVRKDFLKWAKQQETPYVIQETALLFENKLQDFYAKTILVFAPLELRIERLLTRDNSTREQIEARMKNQLDDLAKLELADYSIENIDLVRTKSKVKNLHQLILADC
ncbi:dephospho-CoA kinase [Maribacter sp. X9]|uniref:dephospho-CoA kinase n=1 Tax=Maribacter sp. X9 TaxID=3402159 RepID=UPI003AF3EE0E